MTLRVRLLVAFLCTGAGVLSAAVPAAAQDSHYWTIQYGPRSSQLGGAVIGSVNDVSATFYNPGAVSLASDLAFTVSTNVFEVTGLLLEDGGGEGVDLGNTKSGFRPTMVAGTIKRGLLGGGGILAYSILTRSRGTQDISGVLLLEGEDLPPELEDVVGTVAFTGRYSDSWGGFTYSQALGEHFGIGVTWYGAVRSQERRRESIGQSIGTDGSVLAEIDIHSGSYTAFRTLFKLGGFVATGPITGGLSLTTPSVHLGGSGDLLLYQSVFNTTADAVALAAAVQPDLSATYKSPLSVGAGLAWRIGGARLHGSLEWFDKVESYFVMQGEDAIAQTPPGLAIALDAIQEQDEVLNWALGLEYAFSPKSSGYLSYFTDNSTRTDEVERANLGVLPVNISNVSLGTDFVVKSARLTLGFGFGWGSKVDQNLTDLLRQDDPDFEATYVFRSMKLLFGFEIGVG